MIIILLVALIVCILGALMYALAANAKLQELGRLMFFAGLLVTLWHVGSATVRL